MSVATLQTKWRHADHEMKAARRSYFKAVDSKASPTEVTKAKKKYELAEEKAIWALKELKAAQDYEERHQRYQAQTRKRR